MIIFNMFFGKSKHDGNNVSLIKKIEQLVFDIEILKKEAEQKLQLLENTANERLKELEAKLAILEERSEILEERTRILEQVLSSMDPVKRVN